MAGVSQIETNSVKEGSEHSARAVSLGRGSFCMRVDPDRNSATACTRVATWNVRTLYQAGKLVNVGNEMRRLGIDILGLSEVRWPQAGEIRREECTFVYSGPEKEHEHGVGVMLGPRAARCMQGYWAVSDRVILVKLNGRPFNVAVIQVYAPTSSSSEAELEQFYADMDKAIAQCKSQEILFVMGNLNAKVGRGKYSDIVAQHGLGERNERGDL